VDDDKYEIIPYQDLIDYATHKLDAIHSTTVARHVASCAACAQIVDRAQRGTAMPRVDWQEIRRSVFMPH
jgi:hypothetical protein